MTKVKICGITNIDDALIAAEYGADLSGFNFYNGSKRFIDAAAVKEMVEHIPDSVQKAGVFVDHTIQELLEINTLVGLDMIQLHGSETPDTVNALREQMNVKVVKAFRVAPDFDAKIIDEYEIGGILLDSHSANQMGGTGLTFDWGIAANIAKRHENVFLAGGLGPENVSAAIKTVRPYAVDVASGVESAPGKKDAPKMRSFIRRAKETI